VSPEAVRPSSPF